MSNRVSKDATAAAFRTMVVPMKLPPEPDCSDAILQYLTEQVVNNKDLHKPNDATWMLADHFCKLHQTRYFSAKNIQQSFTSMVPGGVRAFYVKAQNAVLMMYRLSLDPSLVEVYAWAAQLPPDYLLGTVEEPLRYRIPESAVRVKYSLLADTSAFSELLYDLSVNEQPEALPTTYRAGNDVLEERGSINPMFVTEWLVRALDGQSIPTERENANALLKKVRDEARYGMGKLLWRRSPLWFALKSTMHLATRLTLPDRETTYADLSYKLWVTDVLATLYTSKPATRENHFSDLEKQCGRSAILEGARRVARRVEKLKQKPEYSEDTWERLNGDACQMRCEHAIEHGIRYLRGIEGGDDPVWARVRLSEGDVQNGLVHKMANGMAAIERLKKLIDNGHDQGSLVSIQDPPAIRRHRNMDIFKPSHANILADALSSAMKEDAPWKIIAALRDIHDNVIRKWKSFGRRGKTTVYEATSEGLLQLLRINLEVSARFGKNDVRIESLNTVLISLTIVLLLDRINCKMYPLLSEHKLGLPVGNDQFLNVLYLAQQSEKEHLSTLEKYINSRNMAPGPVFVSERWGEGSFQTKFAKNCPQMREVHSEIMAQCHQNEQLKVAEYHRARSRYDDLASKVNRSSCQCKYNDHGYKVSSCKKCNWVHEMRGINVCYYERLLPDEENDQWAVVYELTEPSHLSCLREALYLMAKDILDNPATISTPSEGTIYHWKEDSELHRWNVSRACPLRLSSVAKKWCQSHYHRQHVTSHDSFVVDSAKNCIQSRTSNSNGASFIIDIDRWSWSIERKCTVHLKQPRYQALQKFVSGWKHNENQVLCDKSEAHRDRKVASANIPLTEFEAIGRLRAGHSLQIERFVEAMSQRSISFREVDVVTTAIALLWQTAPNSADTWWRDTWQRIATIVGENNLAVDCARHAQELLDDARANWDGHNVLLVVTVFLRMTFEHIPSSGSVHGQEAKAKVADVLRFARGIALEWVEKIDEATNRCTKEDDTQHLLAKTAAVASIGVLTFLPHDLLMVHEDLADFLHLRATGRDNQSYQALRRHSWQRQFHIYAEAAAECVLDHCHALIMDNPACLDEFLRLHWGVSRSTAFETDWQRYSDGAASDSWYFSDYADPSQSCRVDIDVLSGLFLVDGRPCQRLPESITSHVVYSPIWSVGI